MVSESELSAEELRTTRYLHEFMLDILNLLANHFGGQKTLNHLRVGNYIGLYSLHLKRSTSNKDIAANLGLSRATVSRIVSDFVGEGWVTEFEDPDDGRRRKLRITPNHPNADRYEREFRSIVNSLLVEYGAQRISLVDIDKRSFSEQPTFDSEEPAGR